MELQPLIDALSTHLPAVMRWSGSVARRMRGFNIALEGKSTGNATTDALTLADLTVQELLVGALRDCDPRFLECRIEAEETTGDLARFSQSGRYTLALDPIDGTKQYRDRTANGYAVIVTLRSPETVEYSLIFIPESGPEGSWVEVRGKRVVVGQDDASRPAVDVLRGLTPVLATDFPDSRKIYVIGFHRLQEEKAELVSQTGLEGVVADNCPGCLYELLSRGEFAGSLVHTPNVYDFPASLQIARALGGDSLWVHNGQPVNFHETWTDERANMVRLPGIVATSANRNVLQTLVNLARDWNPVRDKGV